MQESYQSSLEYRNESKKKSKKRPQSKKNHKYEGYNFNFTKEKEKAKFSLEQEFFSIAEDYEVVKLLGQGSYGTVAKAIERKTNKPVAIKKYMHLYRDKVDSKRILREIAILRRLDHPNVVKLHDIIIPDEENADSIFLVMELCDTDLKSLLYNQNSNLSENQIKKILFDVMKGLEYIHKCGIIHRDLKPANIVVNLNTCTAKLCDFGLAREMILEYDTEKLLNIFLTNPQMNNNINFDEIKKIIGNHNQPIPDDVQELLNENLDVISEELFKKYSGKVILNENGMISNNIMIEPRNLLREIENDKNFSQNSDYYMTYENLLMKDSKLRKTLTPHVITRWYRAPEIILLEPIYTSAVDVWSIGCIWGEMLGKLKGNKCTGPLFPGSTCHPLSPYIINQGSKTIVELSNDDQLIKVFSLLGSNDESDFNFVTNKDALDHIRTLGYFPRRSLHEMFPACNQASIDLLDAMLNYNPTKRISVDEAINLPFFDPIRNYLKDNSSEDYSAIKAYLVFLDFDKDGYEPNFDEIREFFLNEHREWNKMKKIKESSDNPFNDVIMEKTELDDIQMK